MQTESALSPQVLEQIAALERDKAARTPVQRRIDSQLLYAQKAATGQAIVPGLEFALTLAADGRQLLDVRAEVTDALTAQVRGIGADILEADAGHRALHVQARLDQVETIAGLPGVLFVSPEPQAQLVSRIAVRRTPRDRVTLEAAVRRVLERAMQTTNVGSKTSQGDATHRASTARATFGVDGTGVKIGVLSDGVTNLATSQASGDLGTVTVLSGQTGTNDEGTAMLEIIHDLAPGAQLYFATAFSGTTSFATNIRALRAAGCDIIVDDVYYFNESPFQDGQAASVISSGNAGIIAQAVKDVADAGALYFSSAGNSGNLNDNTSGTWEGDFVDGGAAGSPVTGVESGRMHNFGSQNWNVLTRSSANSITLQWSDPLGASANDYDLFRLDSTGTTLRSWSTNNQTGTQDPYEIVSGGSVGDRLIILNYLGNASARFLHLDTNRGYLSIATSGETHGHAATSATNSFGVAATPAVFPGPYPNPFSSSNSVETFSSDGPRRIFYNNDGTAITAGNVSSTGGQVLNKPDLTAADGVSTSVVGFTSFYGTSAAAPHAAAIAALAKSYSPLLTAAQIRTALLGSAVDIEGAGLDRDSGVGIIMADTAVQLAVPYALPFTDSSLVTGTTTLKAVHITELRQYVATLRARYVLSTYTWTDSTLAAGTTTVKAVHITELRSALNDVYVAAGRALPSYTAITAGTSTIRAIYVNELRSAVAAIY